MDKKTVLKVFGEAFLRSMVVLMAIAIVGFAAFFIIKVKSDKKEQAKQEQPAVDTASYSDDELQAMLEEENANDASEESEEAVTEAVTEETVGEEAPDIPSTDKSILVLNSTGVAGVAKTWMEKLKGSGFSSVKTGNYSLSKETQTKIYVKEDGMGKDLVSFFSNAVIEVGSIDSGIDVSTDGVDIFIVIGSDDTTVQ